MIHRRPILARWLERASPTHPLRFLIDDPEAAWQAIGGTYEEMLSYLEELRPTRLDRKRRDFWADEAGVIELRTELLAGYRLGKGCESRSKTAARHGRKRQHCGCLKLARGRGLVHGFGD